MRRGYPVFSTQNTSLRQSRGMGERSGWGHNAKNVDFSYVFEE